MDTELLLLSASIQRLLHDRTKRALLTVLIWDLLLRHEFIFQEVAEPTT